MRDTFDAYFPRLLKYEGGYVDNPKDPGGATNLGVTKAVLEAWRGKPVTKADVRALTQDEAKAIYRKRYWDAIGGDALPYGVDAFALDLAVNSGPGKWKQWKGLADGLSPSDAVRALCERRRKFYRSLPTFGTFGKGWMSRVNDLEQWCLGYIKTHGEEDSKPVPEKTITTSKTSTAAIVAGAAGTLPAVKEAISTAQDVKDTADQAAGLVGGFLHAPWLPYVLAAVVLGAVTLIIVERVKKMREHGI